MYFTLTAPQAFGTTQNLANHLNVTKVKVHLRNGVAEILENHQELMGKVDNDLIEVETNVENRSEKFRYVAENAIFIVSPVKADAETQTARATDIFVYAQRFYEITPNLSLDELEKAYQQKNNQLEEELKKQELQDSTKALPPKIFLLRSEVAFLKRILVIVKELK
jgi:hypothetical protein